MVDFSVITDHPDYQEIISKVVIGVGSKDIINWLKVKYPDPDQKHLHLSQKMLQDFIDKHGDLEATLRRDVSLVKAGDAADGKLSLSLMNNKTYRERLEQLSEEKLDVKRIIQELIIAALARFEQVFDRMQENPTSTKNDYVLLKWFEQLISAIEKADKALNNAPDQVIQHNITIQAVEQHTAVLQEAVRETLMHMSPEMASLFVEIFTKKLASLKAPIEDRPVTLDTILVEAEVLKDQLDKIDIKK